MAGDKGRLGWRPVSRPFVSPGKVRIRKFPGLRVPKNGLETGFILMSAIPAEAGRSRPYAVIISTPGPVSRTSRQRQHTAS